MRTILESMNASESSCGCGPDCLCGGNCGGKCGDENCPCECNNVSESLELTEGGNDASARLHEISEEIQELAREALHLVQQNGGHYERARSYWYGHIMSAAGSEEYPHGAGDSTIIDSVKELKHAGGDYERAAEAMVEYMEDHPGSDMKSILERMKSVLVEGDIVDFSMYAGMYYDGAKVNLIDRNGKARVVTAIGSPRQYTLDGQPIEWEDLKRIAKRSRIGKFHQGIE